MSQATTDTDLKHLIDFDDNLLPFRLTETKVENGRPDILFHWHPELEIQYVYEGTLFEIFKMIRQKDRHYELLLKSKLEELIYLLYFYRLVERKTSDDHYRKNEKIREIIDYINQHYAENLTIEKLSELMGYSKTHFMTIFKQHTGTSCTEFIIQARLNAACEELRNSVKPVLEIATNVGFNNLSNFNRQFKHYYDQTPSQYRKTHSNKKKTKKS